MTKLLISNLLAIGILFTSMLNAAEITQEAKRHMARGQAAMEEAKDVADYQDAIIEFKKSIEYAPDWADAWFNLGVAQESAKNYTSAMESFNKYLALNPIAADSSEIEARIFKLEYKQEKQTKRNADAKKMAQEKNAEANEQAKQKIRALAGTWYVDSAWFAVGRSKVEIEVNDDWLGDQTVKITFWRWIRQEWGLYEYYYFTGKVNGNQLSGDIEYVHTMEKIKHCPVLSMKLQSKGEIQNNGNRIFLKWEKQPLVNHKDCYFEERTSGWIDITFTR